MRLNAPQKHRETAMSPKPPKDPPVPAPSPTTSKPSGCRSRPIAPSRRGRAWSRAPRTCIITPRTGEAIIDGAAGRWCTNAGHSRDPIVKAIQAQAAEMDFAPPFQYANPKSFELASRIAALAPGDLDHVFFCNSGSEAVDTAMKIALAYWNVQRAGAARALHRPRARLSRCRLRRHVGRRPRQ